MRFLKLGGWTVVALLIWLLVHAGDPGQPEWWTIAIPVLCWVVGPAIAPWLIARRWNGDQTVSAAMAIYLVVSSVASGLAYYDAFFRSKSSTSALILIFMPAYLWLGLAVAAAIGICAASRRQR